MFRELKRLLRDETGGIPDEIVTIGALIIIGGGVLVIILNQMAGVGDAIGNWININILGGG